MRFHYPNCSIIFQCKRTFSSFYILLHCSSHCNSFLSNSTMNFPAVQPAVLWCVTRHGVETNELTHPSHPIYSYIPARDHYIKCSCYQNYYTLIKSRVLWVTIALRFMRRLPNHQRLLAFRILHYVEVELVI